MKKLLFLFCLLSWSVLHAQKTINRPPFIAKATETIEIAAIHLSDTATVVDVDAKFIPKNWIRIAPATCLVADNGERYQVRQGVGIELGNTYKNDKNIKLATYASRCIDNEILMYLRKNKKRKADVSLDESLSFDSEGNELHLEDILGTEKDIVTKDLEENDMRKIMLKEIGKLNERDKQIMVLRYGLNDTKEYTQKEVAELLGISQSYISRIEKKVISKISSMIKI